MVGLCNWLAGKFGKEMRHGAIWQEKCEEQELRVWLIGRFVLVSEKWPIGSGARWMSGAVVRKMASEELGSLADWREYARFGHWRLERRGDPARWRIPIGHLKRSREKWPMGV